MTALAKRPDAAGLREGARARPPVFDPTLAQVQGQVARLAVYALCFFDYGIRGYAPAVLGVVLLLSILCLTRRSIELLMAFVPMFVVTAIYVVLSYQRAFDPAWTSLFAGDAILRQAMWVVTLPFVVNLGACYTETVLTRHPVREFWIVLGLLCLNFVVSGLLVSDWTYSIWSYGPFGYLWAPLSIFLAVTAWAVLVERRFLIVPVFLAVAVPVLLLAESSQTRLAYLAMALVLIGGGRYLFSALALAAVAAIVTAGYAWAWIDPAAIAGMDMNAAVRGLMAQASFEASQANYFLGIGFGTEGVKNSYPEIGFLTFNTLDDDFIYIAPHNAFFDVLMRMGLPGLLALLFVFWRLVRPLSPSAAGASLRLLMLAFVFLNLSINVGLQSPFHQFGAAMMLGVCVASRWGRGEGSGQCRGAVTGRQRRSAGPTLGGLRR